MLRWPVVVSDPEGLPQPEAYRQVTVATGNRTVYLAGQVALEPDGSLVGPGDLAKQAEQALLNVATALAAVGGSLVDVAKLTIYVVDWAPEKMADLGAGLARAGERLGTQVLRLITLLGVAALGEPDLLIEIDATAVLD
jgi:enamine deaminase RidA (YjgF/YER057c/UK114 family)